MTSTVRRYGAAWARRLWSGLVGFGAWILSLPPAPAVGAAPPIAQEEADATIDGA